MAAGLKTPTRRTRKAFLLKKAAGKTPIRSVLSRTSHRTSADAQKSSIAQALAGKADDIDEVRGALVAAASTSRGLWYTFLSLSAYLAISVGAVTHLDLFLENPVKLPLLNIDLPLIAFFWVAPILFLIFHAFLLLQLKLLAEKTHRYDQMISRAILDEDAKKNIRLQLPNFVFVQLLAAAKSEAWVIRFFLWFPAWITVVAGPIVLILLIQMQFLPYHNQFVTWLHRGVLIVDLVLLWVFWPRIMAGAMGMKAYWRRWWPALLLPAVVTVGVSCFVATFPGEPQDNNPVVQRLIVWGKWNIEIKGVREESKWKRLSLYEVLFQGAVNEVTGRRNSLFSNTLVLPDRDFVDDKALEEIEIREKKTDNKPWQGERTLSLRGRNLRGAVLVRADLRRADFTGVKLQGATLDEARLNGGNFTCASTGKDSNTKTTGRNVDPDGCANLQGASLYLARLQGASLDGARLQGASLYLARLQGASLYFASLQGASLDFARLQGASLDGARLQGASLYGARLQGASLNHASLQGASLYFASLQGASLNRARLQGASLDGARLQGASLNRARLQGASLNSTFLWRAYGTHDIGDPVRVWVENPHLNPLTEDELAELERHALNGVESDEVKQRIRSKLTRLKPDRDLTDTLPEAYWPRLAEKTEEPDFQTRYQEYLAGSLTTLACEDITGENTLHVTQGLIFSRTIESVRLEAVGRDHLPRVAKTLLDAAQKGGTADCPGVKGLNEASIAQLREWATTAENTEKQTAD